MYLVNRLKSAVVIPLRVTSVMGFAIRLNMIEAHTICALITDDFLVFSQSRGNDLSTPRPEFEFPGLVAGQSWCLCAGRWLEAHEAGFAPRVHLKRTNSESLNIVPLDILRHYATDLN